MSTAKRIDDEVARIMSEAHDNAYEILSARPEQMHLMASVLLERETVDGEACQALLDNKWDEYLSHEDEIIARKEAEEAAARARDERLADPNWRDKEQAAMQSRYGLNEQPAMAQPPAPAGGEGPAGAQIPAPVAEDANEPEPEDAANEDEDTRFDPGYTDQAPVPPRRDE